MMTSDSQHDEEDKYYPDWAHKADHVAHKPSWIDFIPHELWELGEVFFPIPNGQKAWPYPHHSDDARYAADDEILNAYLESNANYGIACAGNLAVIDIDEVMYADEIVEDLPSTLWQRTGSGRGIHLFYMVSGMNTREILEIEWMETDDEHSNDYMHIGEIKCDPHGYVVGPGSKHPSGNYYGPLKGDKIAQIGEDELHEALDDFIHEKKQHTKYVKFEKHGVSEDGESKYTFYNLTADDVISWLKDGKRVPHPAHGSSTGSNFMKKPDDDLFMCWRHNYGATQGCALNPQHLLAILNTGIECDTVRMNWDKDPVLHYKGWLEAIDRGLVGRKEIPYTVARGYAIDKGYLERDEGLEGNMYWDTVNALRCKVTEHFLPDEEPP